MLLAVGTQILQPWTFSRSGRYAGFNLRHSHRKPRKIPRRFHPYDTATAWTLVTLQVQPSLQTLKKSPYKTMAPDTNTRTPGTSIRSRPIISSAPVPCIYLLDITVYFQYHPSHLVGELHSSPGSKGGGTAKYNTALTKTKRPLSREAHLFR